MKILVISDVHGNYTALEAVIASAGTVDAVWCLGDLVGYGPDPNECVERIRALPHLTCIKGNHDDAVISSRNIEKFNDDAETSVRFTREVLKPENLKFLTRLREKHFTLTETLTHGSPRHPMWEYLVEPFVAMMNFSQFSTPLAFVGHSHLPISFTMDANGDKIIRTIHEGNQEMQITGRAILNPGSVGQPRDRDPRASYGLFDPEASVWRITRVEYDIAAVQQRIYAAGLPEKEGLRLSDGW
ncbi:MAG: metallophosphoesterase [Chloroflexi bacterium HGW-Chloroflexi-4]|jgi:predicted phosphodiesterase|nr:MAG: metallophosphoesterase [Chloroflexi bacterium HGW-Chloroflexi-4]